MDLRWWLEQLLPVVVTLLSAAIAAFTVWVSLRHANKLQRAEREAGEAARLAEAYRGAAERVLETLSEFSALDPKMDDMRVTMRQLRSRVTIFQTLTRGASEENLGRWLALECDFGMKLFVHSWVETVHFSDVRKLTPEYLAEMAPPLDWAADTVKRFAKSLIPPVDDEWVIARLNTLMIELSLGDGRRPTA